MGEEYIRVAVDAMGGDNAPDEILKGCLDALKESSRLQVILVGKEDLLRQKLKNTSCREGSLIIQNASEVIDMAEPPVTAIRKKKDSSMAVGMKLVRDGEADVFVSAGNSGAFLVGGQAIVGRIRGIERPPFASVIPTEKGCSLLLDCGANVDARSSHLVQFARMGSIYMRDILHVKEPTVGIINIGAEEEKGNALVKESFPLLKECRDIHFVGSVEARDIPAGGCDVLVCEAFTGNIVLKMYEGTATVLLRAVKKGLMSTLRSKIGAVLIKPALKGTLKTFDAKKYGGAPMLGLKGLIVKMHGSAQAVEVRNTLLQCLELKEMNIADKIQKSISEAPVA